MFEHETDGYKKSEVDYYLKRLDDDFAAILKSHTEKLGNVKRSITELANEIGDYSQVIPQYKSEIESLRERLENIRRWAEAASKIRYMQDADTDAVLANLITQVLIESDKIHELKPVIPVKTKPIDGDNFFEILASGKNIKLDEVLKGFDFYDNNPYKVKAEKKLARIEKKKRKSRA
jgi:predicted RNase H-like nuclease (RuvC/YqgF family)